MMARNRWKSLDYEPPVHRGDGVVGGRGDRATSPREPVRTPVVSDGGLAPVVGQARGAYLLRDYPAVLDLLEPRLCEEPDLPGGQRILADALARLHREPEALERLREAVRQSPADWLARASLASLLLRSCDETIRSSSSHPLTLSIATEAVTHLQEALAAEPRPALRELLGAAHWRAGQETLRGGQYRKAERHFAAAAAEFRAAAAASGAARVALPARRSSAFIGQAVALLASGEVEAAQRLFSRSTMSGLGEVRRHGLRQDRGPSHGADDPLVRFAAGLYELCEELMRLPPAERREAASSLLDLVLAVRLAVGFFDGRQAVSLLWAGGPC